MTLFDRIRQEYQRHRDGLDWIKATEDAVYFYPRGAPCTALQNPAQAIVTVELRGIRDIRTSSELIPWQALIAPAHKDADRSTLRRKRMLVFNIAPEIEKSMQSTPGAKFNSYAASLFGLPRYSIDMHGLGGSYEYLAATIYRFKSELSIPAARGWSSIPLSFLIVALLLVILIGLGTLTKIR